MTIREKLEEIVTKIKTDDMLAAKFKADPINTVKGLLDNIDLDDDLLE